MNSREEMLDKFLRDLRPTFALKFSAHDPGHSLTFYVANGKSFVVKRYPDGDGWDIYIPACERNDSHATFAAVRAYIGLEESPT